MAVCQAVDFCCSAPVSGFHLVRPPWFTSLVSGQAHISKGDPVTSLYRLLLTRKNSMGTYGEPASSNSQRPHTARRWPITPAQPITISKQSPAPRQGTSKNKGDRQRTTRSHTQRERGRDQTVHCTTGAHTLQGRSCPTLTSGACSLAATAACPTAAHLSYTIAAAAATCLQVGFFGHSKELAAHHGRLQLLHVTVVDARCSAPLPATPP